MPRRRRRQSAAQLARTRVQAESIQAREAKKVFDRALAKGVQQFAIQSMNSLAQAGPGWSGEFSASWGFAPEGVTPSTPGVTGGIYRYGKSDVPLPYVLNLIKERKERYTIVNTAEHASIAIDQEESLFYPASGGPVKEPVKEGWGRPEDEHLRYQIGNTPRSAKNPRYDGEVEEPNSKITAEPDWFVRYLQDGGLQQDLNTGFSRGFRE